MSDFDILPKYSGQIPFDEKSPDAGDPDCMCSYCGFQIKEDDMPIRMFTKTKPMKEARFHISCFEIVTGH